MDSELALPAYSIEREPLLSFSPIDHEAVDINPLTGLIQYGPYFGNFKEKYRSEIRVALLSPKVGREKVVSLINGLNRPADIRDRPEYVPPFPGFESVFRVRFEFDETEYLLNPRSIDESSIEHEVFSQLERVSGSNNALDLIYIYLPDAWSGGFEDLATGNDLHDRIKGFAATIPAKTQIINDRTLSFRYTASRSWRMGIAGYVKSIGTPWKLVRQRQDMAYLGLGYSLRPDASPAYAVCCSQLFEADGTGLQFSVYGVTPEKVLVGNPFLSSEDMRSIVADALLLYQKRHAGIWPSKLVMHKTTHFTPEEINGALEGADGRCQLDLLQVMNNTSIKAVKVVGIGNRQVAPQRYPCERGVTIVVDERNLLVWTQGVVPSIGSGNFFQEGKGIPRPVQVRQFAGSTSPSEVAGDILGLTKMDWNNDALYTRLPVTITYAQKLARMIRRGTQLPPGPVDVRYFI